SRALLTVCCHCDSIATFCHVWHPLGKLPMDKTLKVAHFVGLALFLGSIPGHILLGRLADPADLPGFALLMHAKYVSVLALTLSALFLTLLSGIALMLRRGMTPNRIRRMAVKLVLVALIMLNGTLVLRPVAAE